MVILPGIRVIVRGFLCIVRGFLRHLSKKFYVHVLAQCALGWSSCYELHPEKRQLFPPDVLPMLSPVCCLFLVSRKIFLSLSSCPTFGFPQMVQD